MILQSKVTRDHVPNLGQYKLIKYGDQSSVTATLRPTKGGFSNATANASRFSDHWNICRVVVSERLRRQGKGTRVVKALLEMIRERGGSRVTVAPGGYNMRYEDQLAFYVSCGFREVEDEPGLLDITL